MLTDEYIRNGDNRPQTGMSQSTRPGSAIAKLTDDATMRGTFFNDDRLGDTRIVESFKLSNILELTEQEKGIIAEIKRIMTEECD